MARSAEQGKVLILSPEPMTAALLGMLVELTRLEPAFALPDERPEDALARIRPLLVILLDSEVEAALSELFLARAVRRGVGVAVFSIRRRNSEAQLWARAHQLPYFELPTNVEDFARILDQAKQRNRRDRLAGDRRRRSTTERALDGTLVYFDQAGSRWYVYDRRSRERRAETPADESALAPERAADESYRAFINDAGDELRCSMAAEEFRDRTPFALAHQLARASPM